MFFLPDLTDFETENMQVSERLVRLRQVSDKSD